MSQTKLYIMDENGDYRYTRTGSIDGLIASVENGGEVYTLTPPPDVEQLWNWTGVEWVLSTTRQGATTELQELVWSSIKERRQKQMTYGVTVNSVSKVFHTDETSVIQYSVVAGMAALGTYQPTPWKVMDNSWVMLTVEVLKELQVAMSIKTNENYKVAEQHKAAMLLVDNPLEYDYSAGWV